jgi:hypothetical protein
VSPDKHGKEQSSALFPPSGEMLIPSAYMSLLRWRLTVASMHWQPSLMPHSNPHPRSKSTSLTHGQKEPQPPPIPEPTITAMAITPLLPYNVYYSGTGPSLTTNPTNQLSLQVMSGYEPLPPGQNQDTILARAPHHSALLIHTTHNPLTGSPSLPPLLCPSAKWKQQ